VPSILTRCSARPPEAVEKGHELPRRLPPAPSLLKVVRPLVFRMRDAYTASVGRVIGWKWRFVVVFLLIVASWIPYVRNDRATSRRGDQGGLMTMVQLPVGSTLEQTLSGHERAPDQLPREGARGRGVVHDARGMGFRRSAARPGALLRQVEDLDADRSDLPAQADANRAMRTLGRHPRASCNVSAAPAVSSSLRAGFRPHARGTGRPGPREAHPGALPAPRNGRPDKRLALGRCERHGGRADVQGGHRLGEAGALGVPVSSIQSYVDRVR